MDIDRIRSDHPRATVQDVSPRCHSVPHGADSRITRYAN